MNNSTEIILTELPNDSSTTENKNDARYLSDNKRQFLISVSTLSIVSGYFAWATYYYLNYTVFGWNEFISTTCTGYGLLVILYCFFIYGYLNVYFVRPLFYPIFKNSINLFKCKLNNAVNKSTGLQIIRRFSDKIFYLSTFSAIAIYLAIDTKDNRNRLISISGLIIFLFIGYIFSNNRSKINWKTVIWGIILQFTFGLITIRWELGRNILECIGDKVNTLLNYAFSASEFPFGVELVRNQQVFAFRALSTIYFISFLVNILYYYGIMQKVVLSLGNLLQFLMDTSICESVNSAANIFLGMTEAPLLLSPYLKNLTDSEIHSIMLSGFATVAGSVMAAYINYGARPQDLITASIMSAPAALCYSKLMYPETEEVEMRKENIRETKMEYTSVLEAASKGVSNAVNLVHGIIAGLIAFLAAVYFINGVLGWLGELVGFTESVLSLELISGKIFIPVSYIMGVPWSECECVGTLIGIKTMVNEFVAFERMHTMINAGMLSNRTKVVATYAICGFSNPASIGIMTSAFSTLIPNKSDVITRVVFRAWFGGALVCFMTACIAGALMPEEAILESIQSH
ncbi:sodium/nucleoside cotransporter 2-like [Diorhabda carinulata]|uniref:sodium/nucleoside cotransporter 2-like n=1 Tax=Diorhabda carinulata TaxID=1163345 RepID=UPI0025A0FA12|nr:sodium/nucleoside cotransporter 2-like [Diorhabda carinulata]XP_057670758.1 sodium/nucleoside cotransporter 2-like [Diorhabda carinulata]XP_057670759.1 sodium/nucleoside cotransporter 2-like [Diorhabda carinulata]XP_057670760.1 sodium/nucleoside cotransporter 2-like [Diorhabda carinulata]